MSSPPSAAEIRQRMQQARAHLQGDAERLVRDTRRLTDWRYHLRRHPWLLLGAAGAAGLLGFLLVPRRAKPAALDAEALARLAELRASTLSGDGRTEKNTGALHSLASAAARALLRAGASYVGQYVGQRIAKPVTPQQPAPEDREPVGGASHGSAAQDLNGTP